MSLVQLSGSVARDEAEVVCVAQSGAAQIYRQTVCELTIIPDGSIPLGNGAQLFITSERLDGSSPRHQ